MSSDIDKVVAGDESALRRVLRMSREKAIRWDAGKTDPGPLPKHFKGTNKVGQKFKTRKAKR